MTPGARPLREFARALVERTWSQIGHSTFSNLHGCLNNMATPNQRPGLYGLQKRLMKVSLGQRKFGASSLGKVL